jgi:hypothetical protein
MQLIANDDVSAANSSLALKIAKMISRFGRCLQQRRAWQISAARCPRTLVSSKAALVYRLRWDNFVAPYRYGFKSP